MSVWAILMLVLGGLFTGGVTAFAWERLPAWRRMPRERFRTDFAAAIRKADRVQPALLVATIAAITGFVLTAAGPARSLAITGGIGFGMTLLASGAILVPLQRRIVVTDGDDIEAMRGLWFRGHLGRTALSVASLLLVAVATVI
jgi:Domain of unknown function (DUF1772)